MHRSFKTAACAALFLSACLADKVDKAPPTVPQDVVAASSLPTRVSVTWTASTDAGTGVGGYQVFRDGVQVATVDSPAVTYQDDGVVAATAYSYTVKAFDRASPANVSAASAPAGVTTLAASDVTPPSVPSGVVATAASPTQVNVSWTASTDAGSGVAGYQVRRGSTVVGTVNAPAVTFQDATVVASTAYAYSVRAFDAAATPNYSAYSSAANVTTPATPDVTPPSVPQNVNAVAASPTRVSVSWSASTDAGAGVAGYQIRRDGGAVVGTVNAPATSYEDAAVAASTAYAYSVRAFDAAAAPNYSAYSSTANVTTPPVGSGSGLDARPSNTTCLAPARPTPGGGVVLDDAYPNLPGFDSPVLALQAPGDPSRWFVVQQGGVVRVFDATSPNVSTASDFVDISGRVTSGGELGLLGMAFHPDWPNTPEVFLSYTAPSPLRSVISRFTANSGNQTLNAASEQVVLTINQPDTNHNGGNIVFGPDGYLYAGFGDGGGGGDTYGNSQKLTTMLAKMLRIEVRGTGAGHTIPADNPYAANPKCPAAGGTLPCPEIYAFGFRNPWRWSFDSGGTHDLWMADVGQDAWEEVDRVEKGFNYGWNLREGTHCFEPSSGCPLPGTVQTGAILVDPETDYPHGAGGGNSTTGGYVYRGAALPALIGLYVWGDFGSGTVWTHQPGIQGDRTVLLQSGFALSSFAQGADGELYAVDYGAGRLNRFVPSGSPGVDTVPSDLAVACPSAVAPDAAGSVLIPYRLNAPFWSDGAVKQRWMALPDAPATITVNATSGDWDFPSGTVLVKAFRVGGKLVETRLLMRHTDGTWAGYTYEWNDAETAATRVRGGKTRVVGAQTWLYPSEQQCLQCHTQAAGRSLGLETAQQNGDLTYPATGRTANQLATLNAIGVVSLPADPTTYPAYPDPLGATGTLETRARAYLHSNCSQCHRPGGPVPTTLDFRAGTALASTNACNVNPSAGNLGIANAKIIAPGAPASSILLERMKRLDVHRMPPVGTLVVDQAGVQAVSDWIQSLTGCN